jgi:hypothetical protein
MRQILLSTLSCQSFHRPVHFRSGHTRVRLLVKTGAAAGSALLDHSSCIIATCWRHHPKAMTEPAAIVVAKVP